MIRKFLTAAAIVAGLVIPASADPLAKDVFGSFRSASQGPAVSIGFYSRGCGQGFVQLPESGPSWQAMRLSRNRNWGHPELVDFLIGLSQAAQQASFSADQRDRALSEALTLRNQPLAETAAMLRAAPSFQMPGFQQTPAYSVEAPDISGLVEANYRNQVNAANQQQQALYGSAVNLASTALGAPWFGRWLGI